MHDLHSWGIVAVATLVTAALRFLPFEIFGKGRKTPPIIHKLGRVLPSATMGMLVVYCMKGMHFTSAEGCLPLIIAALAVIGLHVWKRNTLLSILGGTLCHMLLVQLVF